MNITEYMTDYDEHQHGIAFVETNRESYVVVLSHVYEKRSFFPLTILFYSIRLLIRQKITNKRIDIIKLDSKQNHLHTHITCTGCELQN